MGGMEGMRHRAGAIHRRAASGKSRVRTMRAKLMGREKFKGPDATARSQGNVMSRFGLILIVLLLLIVGGLVFLSTANTEVQPQTVEKAMLNEAQAK